MRKEKILDLAINNAVDLEYADFEKMEKNEHVSVLFKDELIYPIIYHIEDKYGVDKWEHKKRTDFLKNYGARRRDILNNIYKRMLKGNEVVIYKSNDGYDDLFIIKFSNVKTY